MKIAIIGGGSSAHLLAVLLSGKGHSVKVLTSRPSAWQQELEVETEQGVLSGRITGASANVRDVVGDAQVAILCMPVHQYPNALERIMPTLALNKNCMVGTVYGQGGFDWMVKYAARQCGCVIPCHFAVGLLPWIARTKIYGRSAISYGPKLRNGIATSNDAVFEFLQHGLLDDFSFSYWGVGEFERVPNFVTLTLTVDNQIIHPSRCFTLCQNGGEWENLDAVPYFYRDWDDFSSEILSGVDADYTKIREALFSRFPSLISPYNLNYLELEHWSYGSHNPDITGSFVNSKTLRMIKPPVVRNERGKWELDVEHRFFKDDFAFGLEIAKRLANELDCEVQHIDRLIEWFKKSIRPNMKSQGVLNRSFDCSPFHDLAKLVSG